MVEVDGVKITVDKTLKVEGRNFRVCCVDAYVDDGNVAYIPSKFAVILIGNGDKVVIYKSGSIHVL